MAVNIRTEETPNPNARRFVVDRPVQDSARGRFYTSPSATDDPLVAALFAVEGVSGVMLLPNSITVNKDAGADWKNLEEVARETIRNYFDSPS